MRPDSGKKPAGMPEQAHKRSAAPMKPQGRAPKPAEQPKGALTDTGRRTSAVTGKRPAPAGQRGPQNTAVRPGHVPARRQGASPQPHTSASVRANQSGMPKPRHLPQPVKTPPSKTREMRHPERPKPISGHPQRPENPVKTGEKAVRPEARVSKGKPGQPSQANKQGSEHVKPRRVSAQSAAVHSALPPKADAAPKRPAETAANAVKPQAEKPPEVHDPGLAWRQFKEKASHRWKAFRSDRLLFSLACAALILGAITIFLLSPLFHIEKIEMNPVFFLNKEDVLTTSGLKDNQHFLQSYGGSLDAVLTGRYLKAEQRIMKAYPQLKGVEIRLHFPGEIKINIKERIPIAFLQIQDGAVMIDREGIVCGIESTLPQGLPVIKGISVVSMEMGKHLVVDAPEDLNRCIAVMSALVEADFERQSADPLLPEIKEIRSSGYRRVNLRMIPRGTDKVLTVACSDSSYLKNHFIWLSEVLAAGIIQEKLPGTLDLIGKQQVFMPDKKHVNDDTGYVWQDNQMTPQEQAYAEEQAYKRQLEEAARQAEQENQGAGEGEGQGN